MTDSDKWWARIKYVEEFLDYVPVKQISECDENWRKSSPFQPKHLTDFVCNKVYVVETDKFNRSEDDEPKLFYALIGSLGESEESLRKGKTLIKWPDANENCEMTEEPCKACAEIIEAGTGNVAKRRKTSKPCCSHKENTPQPLFSLIKEFKTDTEVLAASIQEQFELVIDQVKKLKKRLYTDICVYNPRFDDPYLPLLRASLINCFKPIERSNRRLKLKSLAVVDIMKIIQNELKDRQLRKILIPSVVIVFLKVHVDVLRRLEAALLSLNESFVDLMVQIVDMEERLMDTFVDVHIFGSSEEEVHFLEDTSSDDSEVEIESDSE